MVMFPVLDEASRLQYLQALGVTSWLPTEPLVGSQINTVLWQDASVQASNGTLANDMLVSSAMVSAGSPLPVEAAGHSMPSTTSSPFYSQGHGQQPKAIDPQVQTAALAEALGALTATTNKLHLAKAPDTSSVQAPDTVLPTSKALRPIPVTAANADRLAPLHLGLSWYDNGVVVVNDIPVQEGAAMSSPIQRLQTAIVNALRSRLTDTSIQTMPAATMEFNWPLVPGPHADHSLMGAQSGLKYSLIKLLQDHSCSRLLVMGPAAVQLLKPDMALGESGPIELFDMTIQAVYSHSLHQLLAVPSLKAETWIHLQSLPKAP
jgi:hypothetical protein